MKSIITKITVLLPILLAAVLYSSSSYAAWTRTEALSACQAAATARGAPYECHDGAGLWYGLEYYHCAKPDDSAICGQQYYSWDIDDMCDVNAPDQTHYETNTYGDAYTLPNVCDNSCGFAYDSLGAVTTTTYNDNDSSGSFNAGDTYTAGFNYSAQGASCEVGVGGYGSPVTTDPSTPQSFDCTNVDCSDQEPPPIEGGGTDTSDPNDSGGSDSNNTGGNSGTGDGDPDTAGTGDGTGDGDTDGDGDRDIDCNPLSNPDCAYSGSASASATCGAPPTCTSSEPVECAQLTQSYNTMCAVLTAAKNEEERQAAKTGQAADDCDAPPACTSDNATECVAIRQTWENACMVMGLADLDGNLAPWELGSAEYDTYNRDLADEATEIDLTSGVDESGFASGSCPAPLSTTAFGANVSIDFSAICSVASIVRVFVILMSLMWAAPFIVRSF